MDSETLDKSKSYGCEGSTSGSKDQDRPLTPPKNPNLEEEEAAATIGGEEEDKEEAEMAPEQGRKSKAAAKSKIGREVVTGKKEKRTRSAAREPVAPVERPTRERKTVERFGASVPQTTAPTKTVSIQQGSGTKLRDIPNVYFKFSKIKVDENLHALHTILLGRKSNVHVAKKNILQFSGFVWSGNEEKEKAKVKKKLDKLNKQELLDFCELLDIQIAKSTIKKEEALTKLMEFLESPYVTRDVVLAEQVKNKKYKRTKHTSLDAETSSARKTKIHKKNNEHIDRDENEYTEGNCDDGTREEFSHDNDEGNEDSEDGTDHNKDEQEDEEDGKEKPTYQSENKKKLITYSRKNKKDIPSESVSAKKHDTPNISKRNVAKCKSSSVEGSNRISSKVDKKESLKTKKAPTKNILTEISKDALVGQPVVYSWPGPFSASKGKYDDTKKIQVIESPAKKNNTGKKQQSVVPQEKPSSKKQEGNCDDGTREEFSHDNDEGNEDSEDLTDHTKDEQEDEEDGEEKPTYQSENKKKLITYSRKSKKDIPSESVSAKKHDTPNISKRNVAKCKSSSVEGSDSISSKVDKKEILKTKKAPTKNIFTEVSKDALVGQPVVYSQPGPFSASKGKYDDTKKIQVNESPAKKNNTGKKQQSVVLQEKPSSKKQGRAKSSKDADIGPSLEELHTVITNLLRDVDFHKVTLFDIVRQAGAHFNVDLMDRRKEVMQIIKDVINSMTGDEEEDEDGIKDAKEDDVDQDSGDDRKAKSSKDAEIGPSTEELHTVITNLLRGVDFDKVTSSDIVKQAGAHFDVDLMDRKKEAMQIIKDFIIAMTSDEEEDEDGIKDAKEDDVGQDSGDDSN